MKCAWQELLNIIPAWIRSDVDKHGAQKLQELRLRVGMQPELILADRSITLERTVAYDDLLFSINTASRYSPWAAESISQGYITAPGGHRIGVCGNSIVENGIMHGIGKPTSICIRVARDFPGISSELSKLSGSVLILGQPGSGKTTLLRDLIRSRSNSEKGSVAVVDEKGEIFPVFSNRHCFKTGARTDVLSFCSKPHGIEALLRNMGPSTIAVDEITAEEDAEAILRAGRCGVNIFATAHAFDKKDLYARPVYKRIAESSIFQSVIIMRTDKTWYRERIQL